LEPGWHTQPITHIHLERSSSNTIPNSVKVKIFMEERSLRPQKHIALIAHDNKKDDLLAWAKFNRGTLAHHELYATGTTGAFLEAALGIPITRFKSGPLGGDQQVGAKIAEGLIDFLVFFWDPLEPQPHDPDVKALLRLAVLYNIPTASNRASADFIISSPLMAEAYMRTTPDLDRYIRSHNKNQKFIPNN
jgi:methylglyoxal synthase